jgi:mono/diheme cytochrome c family protein
MTRERTLVLSMAAMLLLACGSARAQQPPDIERGRALYENHCTACHSSKVHRRFPPSAIDLEALRFIVKVWVEENRLSWGPQEIEDVVDYLDRTQYRFPR